MAGFAAGFALAYLVVSVVSAYLLGWYDAPKWGTPAVAVAMDAEFLPVFLLPALLGHGLALAALTDRLRLIPPRSAAVRGAFAAISSEVLFGLAAYGAQHSSRDGWFARAVAALSVGWLLILPVLTTVAVFVTVGAKGEDRQAAAV